MKNEQLATEILRELVRDAALTIINDEFGSWHAHYHGYRFQHQYYDDPLQKACTQLNRVKGCFEEEEIKEIFDEAEECYRSEVDPQVWALFKNKAEPARSPVADDVDEFVVGLDDVPFELDRNVSP